MRNNKISWLPTIVLLIASVAFTISIKVVDVMPIGPDGTKVGYATLNERIHSLLGYNASWYNITEVIGYLAILVMLSFALAGFIQLIRRRSLWNVDRKVIFMGVLYAVVVVLYIGFDKIALNYRPMVMPGEVGLEPSYPSSHTMLICTVFASAIIAWWDRLKDIPVIKWLLLIETVLIIGITVYGRLASGVHWFTDIIGGVLISATLVTAYYTATRDIDVGRG